MLKIGCNPRELPLRKLSLRRLRKFNLRRRAPNQDHKRRHVDRLVHTRLRALFFAISPDSTCESSSVCPCAGSPCAGSEIVTSIPVSQSLAIQLIQSFQPSWVYLPNPSGGKLFAHSTQSSSVYCAKRRFWHSLVHPIARTPESVREREKHNYSS